MKLKREGFDDVGKNGGHPSIIFRRVFSLGQRFSDTGGQDMFFHEVAKFMLEVGFVTAWFYGMPKKRAGFIIATYEGENFDWGLLSAEALRD